MQDLTNWIKKEQIEAVSILIKQEKYADIFLKKAARKISRAVNKSDFSL